MSADVTRYLTPRGALGYKLDDAERYLRAFARIAAERDEDHFRAATVLTWLLPAAEAQTPWRIVACFMQAEDPRHEHTARRSQAGHQSTRSLHLTANEIARIVYTPGNLRHQRIAATARQRVMCGSPLSGRSCATSSKRCPLPWSRSAESRRSRLSAITRSSSADVRGLRDSHCARPRDAVWHP